MSIILASASPRRKEILEMTNLKFKVITSDVEEIISENENPKQVTMRLAFEKAMSIAKENEKSIIIGADTVVVIDNEILGKPKDENEAFQMLKKLSNNTHEVITGISVIDISQNKKYIDNVVSKVTFKSLSEQDICDYINTKESIDKAGAYGIQGYGSMLVKKIDGDYLNIVGLPLSKLSEILKSNFNINLFTEGI